MKPISYILSAAIAALALSSCSLINDDSDCVDSANVISFTYDMNLKFADAFAHEVKSVTLLGFDTEGTLVYANRARRADMGADGKSLEVRMAPGEYDFLVWAGDYDTHFTIPTPTVGQSKLTDFTCLLNTEATHPDSPDAPADHGHSDRKLEHLFHALTHLTLDYASPSNPNRHTINLTKDTNNIRVMLQQQNADADFNANDFIFEITNSNAHLTHDNMLHPLSAKANVIYHPWAVTPGATDYITSKSSSTAPTGQLNVVLAELTVNRLFADHEATLTVRHRSDSRTLFEFPLINYALMVRGEYWRDMDPQEYLDRQDEYALTFILDKNQQWTSVVININGWRLVETNQPLS